MSDDQTPSDNAAAEQLAAFARELERVRRELAQGSADADSLGGRVDAVLASVEGLAERADKSDAALKNAETSVKAVGDVLKKLIGAGAMTPFGWLLRLSCEAPDTANGGPNGTTPDGPEPLRSAEAAKRLDDLARWVADVYLRYTGAALTSCWAWHPDVVEELLWLRGLHKDAYQNRGASYGKIGDWHERWRPGVVKRVAGYLSGCDMDAHLRGGARCERGAPAVPLAAHLPTVAAAWADLHETAPVTPMISAQAAQIDAQRARA
jgi:hypothetical protein